MRLDAAVKLPVGELQPDAADEAFIHACGQLHLFSRQALQLVLQPLCQRLRHRHGAHGARFQNAVRLVVAHTVLPRTVRKLHHRPVFAQELQKVQRIGMHALAQRLVQQAAAFLFRDRRRAQQPQIVAVLAQKLRKKRQILADAVLKTLAARQIVQRSGVNSGCLCHDGSPSSSMNFPISASCAFSSISFSATFPAISTARSEISFFISLTAFLRSN